MPMNSRVVCKVRVEWAAAPAGPAKPRRAARFVGRKAIVARSLRGDKPLSALDRRSAPPLRATPLRSAPLRSTPLGAQRAAAPPRCEGGASSALLATFTPRAFELSIETGRTLDGATLGSAAHREAFGFRGCEALTHDNWRRRARGTGSLRRSRNTSVDGRQGFEQTPLRGGSGSGVERTKVLSNAASRNAASNGCCDVCKLDGLWCCVIYQAKYYSGSPKIRGMKTVEFLTI
ncbi:Protein of unknown function [Gryllus bimaculatus]|nr:Protein of unknown function [Gryllus bimaculatus]